MHQNSCWVVALLKDGIIKHFDCNDVIMATNYTYGLNLSKNSSHRSEVHCEELKLKDVILVAHSVSSMIGLLAAVEKSEFFKDLILIGPSPCYINDLPSYKGVLSTEKVTLKQVESC